MSWWVYLEDRTAKHWCSFGTKPEDFEPEFKGDEPCPEPCYPTVDVERQSEGGTYVIGGSTDAELNITYNYSKHYYRTLDEKEGLDWLSEKFARDCVGRLEKAIKELGTERSTDYWSPTPGNAGYALSILLDWANQHPNAVFRVS
jgi:hypothetical protein